MIATGSTLARSRRLAVVVLAAVLAISLAPFAGAQGASSGAPFPPPAVTEEVPVGNPVHFRGDTTTPAPSVAATSRVAPKQQMRGTTKRAQQKAQARAKRAQVRAQARAKRLVAWRGGVLRYSESLPPEWDWSLQQAVAQWNSTGANIRLVPASSPGAAQLRISFADIGASAGLATVGRTKGAFVKLSNRYREFDADDAYYRVEAMAVLAHEIGHVLGLGHTNTRCGLMSPMLDIAGCGVWSPESQGEYRCPVVETSVINRATKLYGGRARAASGTSCLVDPLPGAMDGVWLEPGEESFTVTWTPPTTAPAASMAYIRHWDGDCDVVPDEAVLDVAWLAAGSWSSATRTPGCVQVTAVNRYGIGTVPQLAMPVV